MWVQLEQWSFDIIWIAISAVPQYAVGLIPCWSADSAAQLRPFSTSLTQLHHATLHFFAAAVNCCSFGILRSCEEIICQTVLPPANESPSFCCAVCLCQNSRWNGGFWMEALQTCGSIRGFHGFPRICAYLLSLSLTISLWPNTVCMIHRIEKAKTGSHK